MAIIGAGVTLRGQTQPDSRYTFVLDTGIVAADIGKPVSLKAGSANTVKIAADGDLILGRLYSVEDRGVEGILVGAVETRGGFLMNTTGVIAIGNSVVGSATAGSVKAGTDSRNRVCEIPAAGTAVVLFL
ncbi:MAG TPA: hypothetical protein PLS38_09115 [Solirubrobacterales bacterium]|nr:hypothetical protein [Solirubrobacterales bacterium]